VPPLAKRSDMPIISLIITLAIIGVLMWLLNTYVPMSAPIKQILNVVVIICVVLWLLSIFGIFSGSFGNVPRVR
jgi:hypothetical protein